MNNIDINLDILTEVIGNLKTDNAKINEIEENIKTIVVNLDNNVWNSSEKYDIVYNYIPYLETSEKKTYEDLNSCVELLNTALNKYIENNNALKKDINNL